MTKILQPTEDEILLSTEADPRLDTGMKVSEAITRARQWWDKIGARTMKLEKLRQKEPIGGADNGNGTEFVSDNPDSENFLPSGILNGQPWDALTKEEKMRVTKVWHHTYVRAPQDLTATTN